MITALSSFPTGLPSVQLPTGGCDPAAFALSLAGLEAITSVVGTERQSSADPGKELPDVEEAYPEMAGVVPPSPYLALAAPPPVEPRAVPDDAAGTGQADSPDAVSVTAPAEQRPTGDFKGGPSDLLQIRAPTVPLIPSPSSEARAAVADLTPASTRRSEPTASPSASADTVSEATTPIADSSITALAARSTPRPVPTKQPALGPDIRIVLPTKIDDVFSPIAPGHRPIRFDGGANRPISADATTTPMVATREPQSMAGSRFPCEPTPTLPAQSPASPAENAGITPSVAVREAPAPTFVQPAPATPAATPVDATSAQTMLVAEDGRNDAPTPDRRDGATPVRLVAREPEAAPPPAGRPIIGPAAQVFAAELRRGVREGRAPGGVELTAATPLAALDLSRSTGAQATALSESLDMLRADWPGVMVDRIERLRDAADAADTRIRLVPDALGAIDLSVRREGETVHVHFAAEQAATRALLQDAAPRLAEAAEARGLKLGQTDIGGGSDRNDRRPPNDPHPVAPAPARTAGAADEDDDDTRIA